jgi:hypothetical protein
VKEDLGKNHCPSGTIPFCPETGETALLKHTMDPKTIATRFKTGVNWSILLETKLFLGKADMPQKLFHMARRYSYLPVTSTIRSETNEPIILAKFH